MARPPARGWAAQRDPDGEREPALVISPNPARWTNDTADATVPGAFIGLARSLAARKTPARFVAEQTHPECTPSPARTTHQAGIRWTVAFTACRSGKTAIVEAAGVGPGDSGLVYLRIAPPAASAPTFVDDLLAGVQVR